FGFAGASRRAPATTPFYENLRHNYARVCAAGGGVCCAHCRLSHDHRLTTPAAPPCARAEPGGVPMGDHHDPNGGTLIFSDIDVSAADLYDLFGFPSDDAAGGEKVIIALTFASIPKAGILDSDLLYRILITPDRRVVRPAAEDHSLDHLLKYFDGLKNKYLG